MNKEVSKNGAQIRLLIAAPSLDILGGQSHKASLLLDWLSKEPGVTVSFVPHNPRLPGALRWLQRIKYVRTVVTSLWYWMLLLGRVGRCDVLHVFSASYYSYLLSVMPALFIATLYGKKSVLNYHSGEAEDHLKNWPLTAVPTMKWASAIVVQSGYLQSVFARFGLKAEVISNAINLGQFSFRERKPLQPVFLSNRLHEPLYNVPCIVRAFAIIQQRYPESRLIVAGDGTLRNELEALVARLSLNAVEFVGRVGFDQMPGVYNRADIYLNSPNLDNMPSSILESYSVGMPVVTTEAGGIPFIVTNEETGLLVGLDDHVGMANAAMRLLEDQALSEKITRQALKECDKYSDARERRSWIELYRKLFGESRLEEIARGKSSIMAAMKR